MSAVSFADPLTERLVAFVRGIGIDVRTATLPDKTFLPGLDIRHGAILVDEERLTYPGDILQEAGNYIGLPLLQFYGMAVEPKRAAAPGVEPYPTCCAGCADRKGILP
jgi:hypothetical protein